MKCPHCESVNVNKKANRKDKKRYFCKDCSKWFSVPIEVCTEKSSSSSKRFVITACQNNTSINQDFLRTLKFYCEENSAQLCVVPILYRPSHYENVEYNIPPDIDFKMINTRYEIHPDVFIMGSFNFVPTSVDPLSGLDSLSKGKTLIVPSPQLMMRSLTVAPNQHQAILISTGAISNPEYTSSKVGEKAKFNHSYSAIVVEIDSDLDYHIRVLDAKDDGDFYDIGWNYSINPDRNKWVGIDTLVTGDEHAIFADESVKKATYTNTDSIVNSLIPAVIVRHDVLDCYAFSHHHKNDSIKAFTKYKFGTNSIQAELDKTIQYISETTPSFCVNYVVSSNHNDHLTKWLKEVDIRKEPWNALIYHQLMYEILSNIKENENGDVSVPNPFEIYCEKVGLENIRFLNSDDSYMVGNVELSQHGHTGFNGSRGSINQYARLANKYVIGHSHTAGIRQGAYQVGTSSKMNLEYAIGPSSWGHVHCILYEDGKRQLIRIINGKWKL